MNTENSLEQECNAPTSETAEDSETTWAAGHAAAERATDEVGR